jgi:hypothetical protein
MPACTSWTACEGSSLAAGKYLATTDRDNKVRVSILPAEPLKVGDVIPATGSIRNNCHIAVICGWIQEWTRSYVSDVDVTE